MSLKSQSLVPKEPVVIEGEFTEVKEVDSRPDCWCIGRKNKIHKVGDPFCNIKSTYKVPDSIADPLSQTESRTGLVSAANIIQAPSFSTTPALPMLTFDEDLVMSCINRAIMKSPGSFVTMLEDGKVNHIQARKIHYELRSMGYCIQEEEF